MFHLEPTPIYLKVINNNLMMDSHIGFTRGSNLGNFCKILSILQLYIFECMTLIFN